MSPNKQNSGENSHFEKTTAIRCKGATGFSLEWSTEWKPKSWNTVQILRKCCCIIHNCFFPHLSQWNQIQVKYKEQVSPTPYFGTKNCLQESLCFTQLTKLSLIRNQAHLSQEAELWCTRWRTSSECQKLTQGLLEPFTIPKNLQCKMNDN